MSRHFEDIVADYNQAHEWLLSLITDPTGSRYFTPKAPAVRWQEYREQIVRLADFLDFAGRPHEDYGAVHIAGTSGKGSVAVMTAAIMTHLGLRTGLHISPYLQLCNEKLIIDDQMISLMGFSELISEFRRLYAAWQAAGAERHDSRPVFDRLKYGEAWVALTFLWFAREKVDWAVIETGVGGRYDPTNVLPAGLSLITNVDRDHVVQLGPGLADIARHKAGIIKPGCLAVTAVSQPVVQAIVTAEAAVQGARLFSLGKEFDYSVADSASGQAILTVQAPFGRYEDIPVPLLGDFQPVNAALAVAGVDVLAAEHGWSLTPALLRDAFQDLTFPGRMEIMQSQPLVMLDGAHNPHKMAALADSLAGLYPDKKVVVILGSLITKDARAMVETLAPLASRFHLTQPHVFGKPAVPPHDLAAIVGQVVPHKAGRLFDNVGEALEWTVPQTADNELLLVTGSLYLVGEARSHWRPVPELMRTLAPELSR